MTPAERQLVTDLFDRLATLEDAERDAEAERLIKDGLRQAPNAVYALVQSVLVQDEALKQADARIRELEAGLGIEPESRRSSGFLDSMRDAVFGERRGSVPSVRSGDTPMGAPTGFRTGAQPMPQEQPPSRGGSFLGTAAAAAAGVIGGSLLLDGIRSMTGQRQAGFGMADPAAAAGRETGTPWGNAGGGGELARQAGLEDIGRGGAERSGETHSTGLFGESAGVPADEHYADFNDDSEDYDDGLGFGGDDGGDGSTD